MAACTQRGRLQGKTVDLPWYEAEIARGAVVENIQRERESLAGLIGGWGNFYRLSQIWLCRVG